MDNSQITPTSAPGRSSTPSSAQDADTAAFAALFADGATLLRLDGRGERTDTGVGGGG